MKSLIVLHGAFNCNSGIQVFHVANGLTRLGWDVAVASPSSTEDVLDVGDPEFECLTHADAKKAAQRWAGQDLVVHAWTPRERVRKLTEELVRTTGAPFVVHLEDNEERIASAFTKIPYSSLRALPQWAQGLLADDSRIHPTHHVDFLARAAGVTMVTGRLAEFNVSGRPHAVLPPGVDADEFSPVGPTFSRDRLGLGPEDFVLVYHGNLHTANRGDVRALYAAVTLLRERGRRVRLVRLGYTSRRWAWTLRPLRSGVVELGVRPRAEVPEYLRLADAFVQPGAPDEFNSYRFPSKIPEFLAMGRPVVLPACNIGLELTDGHNALLLRNGTALEIAESVERLMDDPQLRRRLGEAGREFAARHLDFSMTVATVSDFLANIVREQRDPSRVAADAVVQ